MGLFKFDGTFAAITPGEVESEAIGLSPKGLLATQRLIHQLTPFFPEGTRTLLVGGTLGHIREIMLMIGQDLPSANTLETHLLLNSEAKYSRSAAEELVAFLNGLEAGTYDAIAAVTNGVLASWLPGALHDKGTSTMILAPARASLVLNDGQQYYVSPDRVASYP